jgi:antirestriction protein ArdC
MKLIDLHQTVTDRIIAEMQKGVTPWEKGWNATTSFVPANAITGRRYSGMNILMLWLAAQDHGYSQAEWLTFKQANEVGAKVKKGEKATPVLFVSFKEEENEKGETVKKPFTRIFYVFNLAQVDGLDKAYPSRTPPVGDERYDNAEAFLSNCGIRITYGGDRACYVPHEDRIMLPPYSSFNTDDDFFAVGFHEAIHGSGHKERLNRVLNTKFRSPEYRFEELIAELGSAFLCAQHGYPFNRSHPAYLDSWIKAMKDDNQAIFRAASYASQAAEYLTRQVENAVYAVNDNTPEVERQLAPAE